MAAGDPAHQFQMMLKPLQKAVQAGNLEAALTFAGHLLEIGGSPEAHEDRKAHFLLSALEGAPAGFKAEFAAAVIDRHAARLGPVVRDRLSSLLDRL